MQNESKIQGYLAFDGDILIGWYNAADIDSYAGFVPEFARMHTCEKTVSIVCFEISPEYRGIGIVSVFIDRVCIDAKLRVMRLLKATQRYMKEEMAMLTNVL